MRRSVRLDGYELSCYGRHRYLVLSIFIQTHEHCIKNESVHLHRKKRISFVRKRCHGFLRRRFAYPLPVTPPAESLPEARRASSTMTPTAAIAIWLLAATTAAANGEETNAVAVFMATRVGVARAKAVPARTRELGTRP